MESRVYRDTERARNSVQGKSVSVVVSGWWSRSGATGLLGILELVYLRMGARVGWEGRKVKVGTSSRRGPWGDLAPVDVRVLDSSRWVARVSLERGREKVFSGSRKGAGEKSCAC